MSDYQRLRTPFVNMSFTPDVPSNALGPNEYSSGLNVEADVRGIKKVAGEHDILSTIPGNVIFVESGYRSETNFVYIVATREGRWYMITTGGITNITPGTELILVWLFLVIQTIQILLLLLLVGCFSLMTH